MLYDIQISAEVQNDVIMSDMFSPLMVYKAKSQQNLSFSVTLNTLMQILFNAWYFIIVCVLNVCISL